MEVQDYTEKSIVVIGEKTKDNKEGLIKLGGKFNAKLKVGPGWIFPKTEKERVLKFVNEGVVTEKKTTYKVREEVKEEIQVTKNAIKSDLLSQINQKIDRILREMEELKELKKLLNSVEIKKETKKEEPVEEEEYVFEEEVKQPLKKLF